MSTHQKYKYKRERQKKKNVVNFFHSTRYDTKFAQLTRDVAVEAYTGRYFRRIRELLQHSMVIAAAILVFNTVYFYFTGDQGYVQRVVG